MPANIIQALITNDGHAALAESFGGPSGGFAYSYGKYFKIGTGAFFTSGGQQFPVTPDPALHDIQAATSGIFWYRETFQPSDILFISASTIQFRCFLDLTQANGNTMDEPDTPTHQDGPKNSASLDGNPPIFFELGLFDPQDVMVAYATFPGETKLPTKTLNQLVQINF